MARKVRGANLEVVLLRLLKGSTSMSNYEFWCDSWMQFNLKLCCFRILYILWFYAWLILNLLMSVPYVWSMIVVHDKWKELLWVLIIVMCKLYIYKKREIILLLLLLYNTKVVIWKRKDNCNAKREITEGKQMDSFNFLL